MNTKRENIFFHTSKHYFYGFLLFILPAMMSSTLQADVPKEENFQLLKQELQQKKLPLMLEFSASYCHYCQALEEDYLEPMLKDKQFDQLTLIRKVEIDSNKNITDFSGKKINVEEFSTQYNVAVTPTILFLNHKGEEIAERLVGIGIPEMFYGYLINGIHAANEKVQSE